MFNADQMHKIQEMLNDVPFDAQRFDRIFNEENVNEVMVDHWTPLTLAVDARNLDAVNYFIEFGADLNANGPEQRSALVQAAYMNEPEIVDVLIDNKAKIPLYDVDGCSLLHIAITNGLLKLAHKLVEELHANVNEVNKEDHTTPLINAASLGCLDLVKLLLRNHAKIDFAPQNIANPLAASAINENTQVMLFLLHSHADLEVAKKSIKARLEEVLTLDLEDVDGEINRLRTGFELLIDAQDLDRLNEVSHNRFEFFNARAKTDKLREIPASWKVGSDDQKEKGE